MTFVIRLAEGEAAPRWFGMAWFDYVTGQTVAMPIPFNVVARALRYVYALIRVPRYIPDPIQRAYQNGFDAGEKGTFEAADRLIAHARRHTEDVREYFTAQRAYQHSRAFVVNGETFVVTEKEVTYEQLVHASKLEGTPTVVVHPGRGIGGEPFEAFVLHPGEKTPIYERMIVNVAQTDNA